jgi:hypothetical protein
MNRDAWIALPHHRSGRIWDRFDADFRFRPSVRPEDWPSFDEPAPSITWNIGHLLSEFYPWHDPRATPYNLALLQALRECLSDDESVIALDWQRSAYEFFPHRFRGSETARNWCIPALPSGEYHLFLTEDFRLGSLGHPWEQTLCIFGEGFVEAYRRLTPLTNDRIIRQQALTEEPSRPRKRKRASGQRRPGHRYGGHQGGPT